MISFPNTIQINKKELSNSLDIAELTTIISDSSAITALAVTATKVDLKNGDRIMINGQSFQIAADASAGARSLTITSITPSIPLGIGDKISIDKENLFVQYQRKTEGKIAGMTVDTNNLGPINYTSEGVYNIIGVDATYIKVLPRDFMINEDGTDEPLYFKDATNTGIQVNNADQEMLAFVNIPYGTTATKVQVWGSVTSKVVEVYAMDVSQNGKGSAIGTGTTNGAEITITSTAYTNLNYLMILVKVTATSNRIFGARVTLTQN